MRIDQQTDAIDAIEDAQTSIRINVAIRYVFVQSASFGAFHALERPTDAAWLDTTFADISMWLYSISEKRKSRASSEPYDALRKM